MPGPSSDDDSSIVGINVTPLVDVVLVLLVVLMVAGSVLAHRGLPLDPPDGRPLRSRPLDVLEVTIDAGGVVMVGGQVVDAAGLRTRARGHAARAGAEARATIAADHAARHRDVVSVVDVLRQEHVERVTLRIPEGAR